MDRKLSPMERARQILADIENTFGEGTQDYVYTPSPEPFQKIESTSKQNTIQNPKLTFNEENAVSDIISNYKYTLDEGNLPNKYDIYEILFKNFSKNDLVKGLIMSEILDKPVSLRKHR